MLGKQEGRWHRGPGPGHLAGDVRLRRRRQREQQRGGSSDALTLGVIVPPTSFAAANAAWANESPYIQAVYDSLLRESPDAEVEPWLATEWSYDDSKTVLTMTLRDDVTFTDGTKFDADVAAQNILAVQGRHLAERLLPGQRRRREGRRPDDLQITLSQPDPALLNYLAQNAGAQESPAAFGTPDEQTNPIGSGPYVLDTGASVVGSKYVFTKNPDYWAPDEQHFDNLTINVYDNIQTQVNAIQGGQVDGVNLIDNSANDQVEATGYQLVTHELDWAGLILFDRAGQVAPELGNVQVRQAITHAIDRDADAEGGQQRPAAPSPARSSARRTPPSTSRSTTPTTTTRLPRRSCSPTPATPTASPCRCRRSRSAPPSSTTWSSSTWVTWASPSTTPSSR